MPSAKPAPPETKAPDAAARARRRLQVAVLINSGRAAEAARLAEQSQDAQSYALLAAHNVQERQYEAARAAYLASLRLDPGQEQVRKHALDLLLYLAGQHAAAKEWKAAESALKDALAIDPGSSLLVRYHFAVGGSLALQGASLENLDRILPMLEQMQSSEPLRPDLAHQLAMLYHRRAIDLEETDDHAACRLAWENAIANWGMALEADEYWQSWAEARQAVYDRQIPAEEIDKLRRQNVKSVVRTLHQEYVQRYSQEKHNGGVARHRDLRARWLLELSTAQALHQVLDLLKSHSQPQARLVASGPLMWQRLGIIPQVEAAARAALKLDAKNQPAQDVLDALTPVGLARMLVHEGMPDDAEVILEAFLKDNPRHKEARAIMGEILIHKGDTLASQEPEKAVETYVQARSYGAPENDVKEKIAQTVLNRVKDLEVQEEGSKAEALLRLGLKHVPGHRRMKDKYAELVRQRAAAEMKKEFDRQPDPARAGQIIDRIEKILKDADRLAGPNHPKILEDLGSLNTIRQQLVQAKAVELHGQAVKLVDAAASDAQYGNRYSACSKLRQAQQLLIQAAAMDPTNPTIAENLRMVSRFLVQMSC